MKKRSYTQLKKMVDHFFSIWIRRRWAYRDGMTNCVTCGARKHWKELQCGHFVSRVWLPTRWDERNAAPQCGRCNVLERGNMAAYALWLSKEYGPHVMQQLIDLKNTSVKFTRTDLGGMIEEYKRRIADLDNRDVRVQGGQGVEAGPVRVHGAQGDDLR